MYSKVDNTIRIELIKKAFNLLCQARVCHRVSAVAANGIPLKAEENTKFFKALYLDVGLCSSSLKLSLKELNQVEKIELINSRGIAEQVVGQLLRCLFPYYEEPELYYWLSTKKGASAEVDYVIQHGRKIVPLEVKAEEAGTLKSLHRFMHIKNLSVATRIYSGLPLINSITMHDTEGNPVRYELRFIPIYLMSELHRLLD